MKLNLKLGLSLGLLTVTLLVCGLVGLYGKSLLSDELTFISGRAWDTADGAMEGVIGLQEQIIAIHQMASPDADMAALRSRVEAGRSLADGALSRMAAAGLMEPERVASLESKRKAFGTLRTRMLQAYGNNSADAQLRQDFDQTVADLLAFIGEMEERGDAQVEQRAQTISDINSLAGGLIWLIMALGIVVAVVTFFISRRMIVEPVQHTAELLRNIAEGDGDLTTRLDANSNDEIGDVARNFNSFVAKLRQLIQQLQQSSDDMADCSRTFADAGEKTLKRAIDQQQETQQVATAMTEMAATVQEISRNASDASDNTRAAQSHSLEGKQIVQQTIEAIGSLAAEVTEAGNVINTLEVGSQEIGGVLDVIKGIAEQTNLLALNAAIEAARAGDQGRGFAVVADEVRALAGRTQQSTAEIQSMIDRLQNSARSAVAVMARGNEQADASVKKVALAGTALERIAEAVESINQLNTQIAVASEEQSAVADEINRNINNINDAATRTGQESEQAAENSRKLAQIATEVNAVALRFKVS
jgi:methyl-accepting chemotaxis protein